MKALKYFVFFLGLHLFGSLPAAHAQGAAISGYTIYLLNVQAQYQVYRENFLINVETFGEEAACEGLEEMELHIREYLYRVSRQRHENLPVQFNPQEVYLYRVRLAAIAPLTREFCKD